MTAAAMLQTLQRWREAGWLRHLDLAFARFVHEEAPTTPPALLLAAALVTHLEGRGHGCLPLDTLHADSAALLGWPAPALAELHAALATWPADAARAWALEPTLQIGPQPGATPLVLHDGRLYLRRYLGYEERIAAQVRQRVLPLPASAAADPAIVQAWLDRLFPPEGDAAAAVPAAADTQRLACTVALQGRCTVVTGGPGTGKTYTAARLLVLLHAVHEGAQPLRVALAAPTGKAAARLRQSIDTAVQDLHRRLGDTLPAAALAPAPARTLHALLGTLHGTRRFRHDVAHPLDVDVLFVDEASMVHLEMMALLLEALPPRSRLVLLGDKDQLASVEAGAVLGDLCAAAEGNALARQTVVLQRTRRFKGPIADLATAVNAGDGAAALALLQADEDGTVAWRLSSQPGAVLPLAVNGRRLGSGVDVDGDLTPAGYGTYLAHLRTRPADPAAFDTWARTLLRAYERVRVLCALREGPWGVTGLNTAIEQALAAAGWLPQRRAEWYEGRPVMVMRNEPALGVFNGDIGVVLKSPAGSLRLWLLDGDHLRSVATSRLADVQTAYAMTVHKSQGSEFAHVVLVLPPEPHPVLTRELVYTGLTRARSAFTLAGGNAGVLADALDRVVRRASGLRQALQADTGDVAH